MKRLVIVDTSSLISLVSQDDSNHTKAQKISASLEKSSARIIIPAEVVTEFLNVLGRKVGHEVAIAKGKMLIDSPAFEILETTELIRLHALQIFEKSSPSVSFTDCLVMSFADTYETKLIFGFDTAFAKSGYPLP